MRPPAAAAASRSRQIEPPEMDELDEAEVKIEQPEMDELDEAEHEIEPAHEIDEVDEAEQIEQPEMDELDEAEQIEQPEIDEQSQVCPEIETKQQRALEASREAALTSYLARRKREWDLAIHGVTLHWADDKWAWDQWKHSLEVVDEVKDEEYPRQFMLGASGYRA